MCIPVFAFNLDTSIDDDIRKNYNPSKLEEDMALPSLPKILNEKSEENIHPIKQISTPKIQQPQQAASKPQVKPSTQAQAPVLPQVKYSQATQSAIKIGDGSYATLKSGTKIKVKSLTNISDKSRKGTKVKFVSKYPVTTTYFTIPMGTIFNGEIVNSHTPQLSGNGGLIVMNIDSMIINGATQPLNANIVKANNKKIFSNNIKGKRTYAKNLVKSIKPGRHFFCKMMRVTGNLANDGSSIILTPFSVLAGTIALGGNVFASPVLALFSKGGSISIHEGSDFEIKLLQDVFIYN